MKEHYLKLIASVLLTLLISCPVFSQEKPQEPTSTAPALSAAGEKRLSDSWAKVLDANTALQEAVTEYNAIVAEEAQKGKFPKGTTFDVSVGKCKPEKTGGFHCSGSAIPRLPQAIAPTPTPPVAPPVDKK